jgi:peptidoglycan/xylan/chitin deacetylase (PgdA/CDA1 family)
VTSATHSEQSFVLHILCLHEVVKGHPNSPWAVTEDELDQIVSAYKASGYTTVMLDHLPRIPRYALAVTFDDGRSGAIAWLLNRAPAHEINATVFIVPGWIDNPESIPPRELYSTIGTWREVMALRDKGHAIGSHTMTHRPLPTLSTDCINHELRESRQRISDMIGVVPLHLSLPYGKTDAVVVRAAREAAYQTICLTTGGANDSGDCQSGVLRRWVLRRDVRGLGLPDSFPVCI